MKIGLIFEEVTNHVYTPENVKTFPAKDVDGSESVNGLERELNRHTQGDEKRKLSWAQGVDLSEPVDLTIHPDGTPLISDGHHRTLAARILRKDLNVNIRSMMTPEVFNLYMLKIKQGLGIHQINPDGSNLNKYPEILK